VEHGNGRDFVSSREKGTDELGRRAEDGRETGDGDGETHRNNLLKRRINDVLKSNNKPPPWPRSYNLLASRLRKEEAKARKHNQR
jgi:hypothetical protein